MNRTTTRLLFSTLCLAALIVSPLPANDASIKAGREAVDAWLVLQDAGKYDDTWEQSAVYVKKLLNQKQWLKAMQTHRTPLGAVKSRTLQSASYTTELQGMPDAKYVVLIYKTSFENKDSAIETIIPMQEADGQWKVMTYRFR